MSRILLVEDDPSIALILTETLSAEHSIVNCANIAGARSALSESRFDLLVLDIGLPDGNGFEFLSELRNSQTLNMIPVLILTSKSSIPDQLLGFSLGADDYLTKPVHPLLIQARVNAKLKKHKALKSTESLIQIGGLCFDLHKQRVSAITKDAGKSMLSLTSLEFRILLHLAKQVDRIFSREQLVSAAWEPGVHISSRTVDSHISHLRSKLKPTSYLLEAVHGAGYRLTRTESK